MTAHPPGSRTKATDPGGTRPRRMLGDLCEGRKNNFDFLRIVLACLVILSHSWPLSLGTNADEPMYRATGGQKTLGELAVEGFFVLSGFLIARSWLQSRSLFSYFKKRILRIYPGFLAAVAFSCLMVGPYVADHRSEYWHKLLQIRSLLNPLNLLYPPVYDPVVNGSLWSIRYEFLCYVGIAVLGMMGALRRRFLTLIALGVAVGLLAGQVYYDPDLVGSRGAWLIGYAGFWPRLLACFLAGTVVYLYRDKIPLSGVLFGGCLVVAVILGGWWRMGGLRAASPLLGAYLLFYLALLPTPSLHHVARHGDLSYGLYLYAFPIQVALVATFPGRFNPIGLFLAATMITAVLAYLSWKFVEEPWLRSARTRLVDDPPLASAPPSAVEPRPTPADPRAARGED